tara:strand:+ start:497 stop:661 length:165 start_codon:yes stop_codon:yes gene_type:complete
MQIVFIVLRKSSLLFLSNVDDQYDLARNFKGVNKVLLMDDIVSLEQQSTVAESS